MLIAPTISVAIIEDRTRTAPTLSVRLILIIAVIGRSISGTEARSACFWFIRGSGGVLCQQCPLGPRAVWHGHW
jgi:hypothetical protein